MSFLIVRKHNRYTSGSAHTSSVYYTSDKRIEEHSPKRKKNFKIIHSPMIEKRLKRLPNMPLLMAAYQWIKSFFKSHTNL